jgi:ATP-dependent Clp protease ATP-binding subunit ClpA
MLKSRQLATISTSAIRKVGSQRVPALFWSKIAKEVRRRTKNNPVLIGEPGVGKSEGAMDASNLLEPALARGFQPVFVGEPTVEDTISILRGLKEKFEAHHGVRISDSDIAAAATLSNRYTADWTAR